MGYVLSDRTGSQLALAALNMAIRRERLRQSLISHSGWGVLYAAAA